MGSVNYELANHLGNLFATVSNKKIGHNNGSSTVDYYTAEVITATYYYPFGMLMLGRKYAASSSSYRYGFNGKEKDDDVKRSGKV